MTKHFTHLHLHSEYSLLDGAIRLPDLVQHAKKQDWKAVGISDHGNIFGAVKFFQLAKKEGIKPVLGVEMYFTPDTAIKDAKEKYHHLILIVQNKVGYQNLCKLMAFAYQEGFYFKPRIDYARLEKYSEGLIVTTACVGGHIPTLLRDGNIQEAEQRVRWFQDLFGKDRFFFEVSPPDFDKQIVHNKLLFEYGAAWGVSCIATSDAHYLYKQDHEAHEILLSVQTKDLLSNPDRFSFGEFQGYVRSTAEMLTIFKEQEEIIWNTGFIADQCDFNFEFGKLFFPVCKVPEGDSQESYFEKLCYEGFNTLQARQLIDPTILERYQARLKEEIELIQKMGFVGYFLVVSDFIRWAKRQQIPVGPGRGSVAGSLVAWALEITNVDPLRYNLLFERFLNPERVSMPDIDIDFCVEGREKVIQYVKDTYGHDCVCQIITFGTMMAKGVIKDVARVLGFPFQDANAITDLIPDHLKITLEEALAEEPKLKMLIDTNPQVKHLFDICFKLEGLTRHASKHAAGVVISPEPLDQTLPLYIPPKTHDLVAQYAMTELESLGFLKMDFLGLKNLTIIDHALKIIKKNHAIQIDLDTLPLDNPKVYELLSQGKSNAIFQFESNGIKEVLRKLMPSKFEDLIAVNALYRPGPLGAGMIEDYIERRHGRQTVVYFFPELKPILEETYGVIVYQEQVMKIASTIAGYSLGAADILRRAMGKKKADVMAEQKELFVQGAKNKNFDEKKAGDLFDQMAFFAGYGFNKSHSTAYALIAYHTAYLKANFTHEFMAACVSHETNNPEQLTLYLQEISDLGIKTILPNINRSEIDFCASQEGILFGLQGIKNVGGIALDSIIKERTQRSFVDLLDFCKRIDLRTANKRVIESLIFAGAMDTLPGNRAQKIAELDKIIALAQEHKEQAKTGQMGLFGGNFHDDATDTPTNPANPTNTLTNHLGSQSTDSLASTTGARPEEPAVAVAKAGRLEGYERPRAIYQFQPCEEWSIKEKLEKEKEVAGFYLSSHPLKSYPSITWLKVETFANGLDKVKQVSSLKEPFITTICLFQSHKIITTKKGDKMAFANAEDLTGHGEIVLFPRVFAKIESWLTQYSVFLVKGFLDIAAQTNCKIKADMCVPLELIFEQEKLIKELIVTFPATMTITEEKLKKMQQLLVPGSLPLQIWFTEQNQQLALLSNKQVSGDNQRLQLLEADGAEIKLSLY